MIPAIDRNCIRFTVRSVPPPLPRIKCFFLRLEPIQESHPAMNTRTLKLIFLTVALVTIPATTRCKTVSRRCPDTPAIRR